MEKAKTFFAILGLGITIGVVLVVFLIFVVGARPKNVNVGGVEFEIPTSTPIPPLNNPVSQPTSAPSNTGNSQNSSSSSFVASSPLVINGTSYSVPNSNSPLCVASQQTGYTSSGVEYNLDVPKGWVIVWDSWKAYWSGGSYENDGLLIVYGNFQGKVTIVNGEFCAVPVEWKDFAVNLRANAVARASRPQFSIGEAP
ncbi:MAG: hypothetical protein L6Q29_04980 [Candidatus Pacebacteria bacterium]|nr:hypothetical protein [Candidatus Paceibacterota bacterium]